MNLEALTRWVGAIPEDVKRDMKTIAPMLEKLGYDASSVPPNYGDPDQSVQQNTAHIREQHEYWKVRELQVQNTGKKQKESNHQDISKSKQESRDLEDKTQDTNLDAPKRHLGKLLQLPNTIKPIYSPSIGPIQGGDMVVNANHHIKDADQDTKRPTVNR